MNRWVLAWNRFFYEEATAIAYSAYGAVFYAYVLLVAILSPLSRPWSFEPIFASDIFPFRALNLGHPSVHSQITVIYIWWASLALSAIGILGKPMRLACFCLAFYVCGQRQNMGFVFHQESTLMLAMILITAAPRFPVTIWGSLVARWNGSPQISPLPSARFRWPTQLMKLTLVYVIFSAALLKLYYGGFHWLTDNVIFGIVRTPDSHKRPGVAVDFLAQHEGLCRLSTILSFALECCFPLVLFSRTLRAPLLLAALSMFFGIWIVIGIHFLFYMGPLFLAFLPWDALARISGGAAE